jgi:hypothetical protein
MPDAVPRVLVVVTNHGEIDKRPATGVWFTEFSEPYAALTGAGAVATVASPLGGPAPVDPRGYPSQQEISDVRDALAVLNATVRLDQVDIADYDRGVLPATARCSTWPLTPGPSSTSDAAVT